MPSSTAPLAALSSKLLKSRHSLHATNLQVESSRTQCDKNKLLVERNDAAITSLEEQEKKLKMQYVEAKLEYEKMHALKFQRRQELKDARGSKVAIGKECDSISGQCTARHYEWTKVHEEHLRSEEAAKAIAKKMEEMEKDKEKQQRRAQRHKEEIEKATVLYDKLKRELEVIEASAAAV